MMDLPGGTPTRLTDDSFDHSEIAPAWSPDGRDIAFTGWEQNGRGHVWRVSADGGTPSSSPPAKAST